MTTLREATEEAVLTEREKQRQAAIGEAIRAQLESLLAAARSGASIDLESLTASATSTIAAASKLPRSSSFTKLTPEQKEANKVERDAWKAAKIATTYNALEAKFAESDNFNINKVEVRAGKVIRETMAVAKPKGSGGGKAAKASKSGEPTIGASYPTRVIPEGSRMGYGGRLVTKVAGGFRLDGDEEVYSTLNKLSNALGFHVNVWATWVVVKG